MTKNSTYALSIFCIIFTAFFIIGYPWFLQGEDMGYLALVSLVRTMWESCFHGPILCIAPNEFTTLSFYLDYEKTVTFFSAYYRPLIVVFIYIQYAIFGLVPWLYYALTIALHAGIATILFSYAQLFVGTFIAAFCSLFFAFHPTLMGWVGKLDTQGAQLSTLLGLGAFIFVERGITLRRKSYIIISWLLFFLCLLSREAFFAFPGIIALACLMFFGLYQNGSFRHVCLDIAKIMSGYVVATMGYLLLRLWQCPPAPLAQAVVLTLPTVDVNAAMRFFYETFWVQWIPWTSYAFFSSFYDQRMYVIFILIKVLILVLLGLLFLTNTKKRYVVFFALATITFYWQFIFGIGLNIKQLYESLPFLILGLACLMGYARIMRYRIVKRLVFGYLALGIAINAYMVLSYTRQLRDHGLKKWRATEDLKQRVGNRLLHKPIFCLGNTEPLAVTGMLQTIWLKDISRALPQYWCTHIIISPTVTIKDMKNDVVIRKINYGFRFMSRNPDDVWWRVKQGVLPLYLKEIEVHASHKGNIVDMSCIFNEEAWDPTMVLLMWFFEEEQFVIVDV